MGMNIKSAEAHRLAAELSRLRGVSITQAVTEAIRHELERENRRRRRQGLAESLLEIGRRCAAHVRQPVASADHARILYDDSGLPK